jgi:hypothetical protein
MTNQTLIHRLGSIGTTLALAIPVMLSGCGSSSSDTPSTNPPATPTTASGVAAVGVALVGATVTVFDASSATSQPASVTTGSDGSFTVDVSGQQTPLAIQVVGTANGVQYTLVAVVASLTPNGANTVNLTPLTHAVAALIAPNGDPGALLVAAALTNAATATNVSNAVAALINTLFSDSVIAAALGSNFNPMTTVFSANGIGIDSVLDQLAIETSAQGVQISNLRAIVTELGALPTPVLLTPANVQNPASAPALPPSAQASDLPSAADIEGFRTQMQACLALPLAQRVTYDGTGTVPIALAAACDFADAGFRSDGRGWVEDMGRLGSNTTGATGGIFGKAQFDNASVGKGAVVLALGAQNLVDAKEFKHPQCNAGPCAMVRYPVTSSSGYGDGLDLLLGKVGGQWAIVGNQLPYDISMRAALTRYIPANPAPPNNPFLLSRFESSLRPTFNPSGRNGDLVRAIRVKGPGLPAAGLVLHRSMRCGTHSEFPLTNTTGSLRDVNNAVVTFNNGSSANFLTSGAALDGTAIPVGGSQTATIPAWSRYSVEVFLFSSTLATPDSPDEVIYIRTDSPLVNAAQGVNRTWPVLSQTFVNAYITPTGAGAGAVNGGPLGMSWTSAGATVISSFLFRQDVQTLTNVNSVTAAYTRRGLLNFEPASYGDTTAQSTLLRDIRSGASLVADTASSDPNPNPRCTEPSLVPVTSGALNYFETGLVFRGPERLRHVSAWFWDE